MHNCYLNSSLSNSSVRRASARNLGGTAIKYQLGQTFSILLAVSVTVKNQTSATESNKTHTKLNAVLQNQFKIAVHIFYLNLW